MIDFSNIFDNPGHDKKPPQEKRHEDTPPPKNVRSDEQIDISKLFVNTKNIPLPKTTIVAQKENVICEMRSVYADAVTLANKIFDSSTDITADELENILAFVQAIVNIIQAQGQDMVGCVFQQTGASEQVDPYVLKLVNVCILSIEIGIELNYGDIQLVQLGVAAFLHDIGLKKYRDIISQSKKLGPKEKKEVENAASTSKEILQNLKDKLGNAIMDIIEQSGEKLNGTGPQGLKGDAISQAAQIIGLVDTYEALTHARPYREKYTPVDALKIILNDRETFNPKLTKILLERIGIYPKGTFVELSTKETAQILQQNLKMPSSPIIKIIYDTTGKKVDEGREINLAHESETYIIKSL
jgi:HD-GYP domain-containing protein (c-di-GMP phosphodiesterase class II)